LKLRGNPDALEIGVKYRHVAHLLKTFAIPLLPASAAQITRWFTSQPVFQHYFDTGNSTVAGFRPTFSL